MSEYLINLYEWESLELDIETHKGVLHIAVYNSNGNEVLTIEMPEEDEQDVKIALVDLLEVFDFSYHLEFYRLEDLENYIEQLKREQL